MRVGALCTAIAREMKKDLLAGGYIQADETPVGVQSAKVKGRTHRGWLWEYNRPRGPVIFEF
jgi:transposase